MLGIVAFWSGSHRIDVEELPEGMDHNDMTAFNAYNPSGAFMINKAIHDGEITEPGFYQITMEDTKAVGYEKCN